MDVTWLPDLASRSDGVDSSHPSLAVILSACAWYFRSPRVAPHSARATTALTQHQATAREQHPPHTQTKQPEVKVTQPTTTTKRKPSRTWTSMASRSTTVQAAAWNATLPHRNPHNVPRAGRTQKDSVVLPLGPRSPILSYMGRQEKAVTRVMATWTLARRRAKSHGSCRNRHLPLNLTEHMHSNNKATL